MTLDRKYIFRLLGVPPRGLLTTNIQFDHPRQFLTIDLTYDLDNPRKFQMIMSGCSQVNFDYPHDEPLDGVGDVIGIHIEDEQIPIEIIVQTTEFGIDVHCKKLTLTDLESVS